MDEFLPRPRLEEILARIRSLRTGVVGDFTLDGYWFADMTRSILSREAPLFPRPVVGEQYSCGGAANVAWNLAALGPASHLLAQRLPALRAPRRAARTMGPGCRGEGYVRR